MHEAQFNKEIHLTCYLCKNIGHFCVSEFTLSNDSRFCFLFTALILCLIYSRIPCVHRQQRAVGCEFSRNWLFRCDVSFYASREPCLFLWLGLQNNKHMKKHAILILQSRFSCSLISSSILNRIKTWSVSAAVSLDANWCSLKVKLERHGQNFESWANHL